MGVGAVVEAAVGERAAEAFVEEQKKQGDLNPLGGETVGVAGAVTLQHPVALQLAQVVAQLVETVASGVHAGLLAVRPNERPTPGQQALRLEQLQVSAAKTLSLRGST